MAAGGTGGHMFPAQALAECLSAQGWEIAMITDARGRKHACKIPADPIIEVAAATISPRHPIKAVGGMLKLAKGTRQAKQFIRDFKPDVVAGFGGYPAFPAMRAAQRLGIPTVLHEQNAVLGRVNRVFAAKANVMASGFETLGKCPDGANHIYVGNPLRQQIIDAIPKSYAAPKTSEDIHIFITGGSLGARLLSETMPQAIAALPEALRARLAVVQQTRKESLDFARGIYSEANIRATCEPFFDDIQTQLANAHYVVARAGASSVSEIAAMGKPSLFVPLAIAMDDHQSANAKALKNLDAANILPESEFTVETVKNTLISRLSDSSWLERAAASAKSAARLDATQALADLVIAAAK